MTFLTDVIQVETTQNGNALELRFSRPVTADDRKSLMDAHNAALNTRPVAPVEGLETALYQVFLRGEWFDIPKPAYEIYLKNKEEVRRLCDQPQAEAMIAAKVEQERLRFESELDKWMKAIGAGITGYQAEAYALMDLACQELVKLRTDNAALTARVKELEGEVFHTAELGITWKQMCRQFDKECTHHQKRSEALETQLAAAKKALTEIDNLDQAMGHELKLDDAFEAVRIARAALEAKP